MILLSPPDYKYTFGDPILFLFVLKENLIKAGILGCQNVWENAGYLLNNHCERATKSDGNWSELFVHCHKKKKF